MSDTKHYDSLTESKEWGTPEWIIETFEEHLGAKPCFDLDAASGAEPRPYATDQFALRAPEWWDPFDCFIPMDALEDPWYGHVWINHPYGRYINEIWGERIFEQAQRDAVHSITALVPASTETDYWHDYHWNADVVTFLDQRLKFIDADPDEGEEPKEDGATFPSAIVTYGMENLPQPAYIHALNEMGQVTTTLNRRGDE